MMRTMLPAKEILDYLLYLERAIKIFSNLFYGSPLIYDDHDGRSVIVVSGNPFFTDNHDKIKGRFGGKVEDTKRKGLLLTLPMLPPLAMVIYIIDSKEYNISYSSYSDTPFILYYSKEYIT